MTAPTTKPSTSTGEPVGDPVARSSSWAVPDTPASLLVNHTCPSTVDGTKRPWPETAVDERFELARPLSADGCVVDVEAGGALVPEQQEPGFGALVEYRDRTGVR